MNPSHRPHTVSNDPPADLPVYRPLTGVDDAAFCRRVSKALALGYALYGSPAATFNGEHVIVAQAVLWPVTRQPAPSEDDSVAAQPTRPR
jgi:hypothetical protein